MKNLKKLLSALLILSLFVSCATGLTRGSTVASESEKQQALKTKTPNDPNKTVVYFYRDSEGEANGYTLNIWLNDKLIGKVRGHQFTKIELPPGEYLIQVAWRDIPARKNPMYTKYPNSEFSKWVNKMERKFKVPSTKKPMLYTISSRRDDYHSIRPRYGSKVIDKILAKVNYTIPLKDSLSEPLINKRDKRIWNRYSQKDTVQGYATFIKLNKNSPYIDEAKRRKKELYDMEMSDYKIAKKTNSLESYSNYLKTNPMAHNRDTVFKKMTKRMKSISSYRKYSILHPHITNYYPDKIRIEMEIMNLGPDEMRVGDILKYSKDGLGTGTLASKIRATNAAYKDFSIKEITYLKKKGLKEKLIEAMIDSTAEHNKQMKQTLANKEMMAEIQKLIQKSSESVKSRSISSTNRNSHSTKSSMPVQCVKLKAALEACRQAGGFLASACKMTARSSFKCDMKF